MKYTLEDKIVAFKLMRGIFSSTSDQDSKEAANIACYYLHQSVRRENPSALQRPRIQLDHYDLYPVFVRIDKIERAIITLINLEKDELWSAVRRDIACAVDTLTKMFPKVYPVYIPKKNREIYESITLENKPEREQIICQNPNKEDPSLYKVLDRFEVTHTITDNGEMDFQVTLSIVKESSDGPLAMIVSLVQQRDNHNFVQHLSLSDTILEPIDITLPKEVVGERSEALVVPCWFDAVDLYQATRMSLESKLPLDCLLSRETKELLTI